MQQKSNHWPEKNQTKYLLNFSYVGLKISGLWKLKRMSEIQLKIGLKFFSGK